MFIHLLSIKLQFKSGTVLGARGKAKKKIGKVIKQTNFRDGKCYAGNKRKKGIVTSG